MHLTALPLHFPLSAYLTSHYPEYYQFLLSFGILGGLSASLLFTPSVSAVGHWFCKRRALATGIACTAGGSGGIGFPFIILYLAPRIGFPWAMRIIGFINAGMCLAACLLLRTRIPPKAHAGIAIDLKALRDPPYATTTLAIFLIEFAVFIPLTYISSYAIAVGVSPQHAYRLNALLNVSSPLPSPPPATNKTPPLTRKPYRWAPSSGARSPATSPTASAAST